MSIRYRSALAVASIACVLCAADSSTPSVLPFSIEIADDSARFAGAPRLQSFAWAVWEGKWIFLAGRTGGYHGVGGREADFPRKGANDRIWVVDPKGPGPVRTFSFPVSRLPATLAAVKDQWSSSNTEFLQDGETLYIAGGYGENAHGAWITYPILSSVNLPSLIEGVMNNRDSFSSSISYSQSPLVQAAGGEMVKLDDGMFYLVGGHVFTGTYRDFEAAEERNTANVAQTYTGEIRKLRVSHGAAGKLNISLVEAFRDPEFARRDLNVAHTILPDGHTLGAAAYGGVFTREQLNFTNPISWSASKPPSVDRTFEQKMSAYSCAKLLLFDSDAHTMYTTFFGGISRWVWDYSRHTMDPAPLTGDNTKPVYFDGLAWIDHITTLARTPTQTYEAVSPARLAGYVGTNAAFLPAEGLAKLRDDAPVLDLKALRGSRVLAGYIYGGIRAFPRQFPYHDDSTLYSAGNVPTRANDLVLAVYLNVPESDAKPPQ